ncbi:hypothetical protein K9L63_00425 [Candidatus Gracilibacteria bacterium]|nr:hypothetical protein [Candidatus Gracilibacteria bacterium]
MKNNICIHIVGQGLFGTFLQELLAPYVHFSEDADIVFLAVPFSAYDEVATQNAGKHLVNICSVQKDTHEVCACHSDKVTSIHPLFGPKSPEEGRTALLTQACVDTKIILDLFRQLSCEIVTHLPNGRAIDGEVHDRIMAKTHLAGVLAAEMLKPLVAQADWVPDNCIPASFLRLRQFVQQMGDISPGTLSSIKANPFF